MFSNSAHEYTIGGVKVFFPVKAYPSQVAMMAKIISSLQKGQNSLLESPTGSGKSLALLCASLAWQKKERQRVDEYNRAVENGLIEPEVVFVDENQSFGATQEDCGDEYFEGFFVPGSESQGGELVADRGSRPENHRGGMTERKIKRKKVPKIYFGTRTHRQITQLIRELKKTVHKDVRMSILGAREHTCIHPAVSKMKNKNEGCRELLDRRNNALESGFSSSGCLYHSNVKTKLSSHHSLNAYRGTNEAWDMEDLVKTGKKVRACPYYASRELKNKSDIIFCPYNYLVEPMIRKSIDIYLKGHIVILDEAHNIEDSARSATSLELTEEDVLAAMRDLELVLDAKAVIDVDSYRTLVSVCSQVCKWMESHSQRLLDYQDYNSQSKVWNGTEVVAEFNYWDLGPSKYQEMRSCLEVVVKESQDNGGEEEDPLQQTNYRNKPKVSTVTLSLLEGFLDILNYLYMEDMRHRDDYRVALSRTQSRTTQKSPKRPAAGGIGGWLSKSSVSSDSSSKIGTTLKTNFWCLNPAVCFDELKRNVRSIILTSGTLSPMVSFSSELDVKFPIQLEANHVIDRRQVWIGTMSHGPTGHCLNATYRNTESFDFQDEMGRMTMEVCNRIPRGVLLFLPSYKMLTKLSERWKTTGLWEQIAQRKVIVCEPRFSDEFEAAMRHFYDVIATTGKLNGVGSGGGGGVDGALFIAVCRGKVSEGLDFVDDNARAVICLGIPFPNVRDVQVDLKKKYNDKRKVQNKDLLSGGEWYEIQAFRALNQALGRCIRHREDWGAIVMVDDRYSKNRRYMNSLSKWVRSGVVHYSDCRVMLDRLSGFYSGMVQFDKDKAKIAQEEALMEQENNPHPLAKTNTSPKESNVMPVGKLKAQMILKHQHDVGTTNKADKTKHSLKSWVRKEEPSSTIEDSEHEAGSITEASSKDTPAQQLPKKFKFSPVTAMQLLKEETLEKPRKEAATSRSGPARKYYRIEYESDDDFQ